LLAPTANAAGQHNVTYNVDWYYAGTGAANTAPPGIAAGSLSYGNLPASAGNSVAFDTTQLGTARVQVTPAAISTGTVYWSGLLRVNSISTLTTGANGMLLGGFNNTAGYQATTPTAVGAVLRIRQDSVDPNVYRIGTGMNAGTGTGNSPNVQFDNATPHTAGETVFIVGSYEFVSGANNDIARMWINPDAGTFGAPSEPAATLTSAPGGGIADAFASLLTFNLRDVNTVGNPTLQLDEFRVGTAWADVTPVPEPSTAALIALGVIGLCAVSRRRA
jgi:hypothetical protein